MEHPTANQALRPIPVPLRSTGAGELDGHRKEIDVLAF